MKICLSILEDELPFSVVYSTYKENSVALKIDKFVYYRGEGLLLSGSLYISKACDLPEELFYEQDAALLCLGLPGEFYLHADLPLLVYPEATDMFLLGNEIMGAFEKYRKLEEKLNEGIYNGYGFQYLVDIATSCFQNEMLMIDANYRVLAQSFEENRLLSGSGLKQPDSNGMLPIEVINYFKGNGTFTKAKSLKEPFFYQEHIFRYRNLCMNIIFEQDFALRIVLAETERPFRDYDPLLLKYFGDFFRRTYESAMLGRTSINKGSIAEILHGMLAGRHVEMQQIQRALSAQKWDQSKNFICMCIKPSSGDYLNHTIYYYCGVMNTHFPGTIAFEFERNIVCLINLMYYDGLISNLNMKLVPMLRDNDFRAGFSNIFEEMDRFVYSFKQASIALATGTPVERTEWFYNFSEQTVDYMLQPFCDFENVMILGAKEILLLHAHDAKNGTAFLQTVKAYYKHNLNAVRTAQSLFIHRATMIHRLQRIKEICGLAFDDADKNLYCQLTLRLLDQYERHAGVDALRPEEPKEG